MNIWAIYYRPSHFRQAGLDAEQFPATLEQLDAIADKLYQTDKKGNYLRVGFMPTEIRHWAAVFGGSFYDPASGKLTLTNPRNVDALEWMSGYARKYDFERIVSFEQAQGSQFGATWSFLTGSYSIVVDGQWRMERLAQYNDDVAKYPQHGPPVDYLTAPIPPPAGGKGMACWSNGNFLVIPTGARNKAGAWAFMRYWSGLDDPRRAATFYTMGGWLPILPEIAEAPVYKAYIRKYPPFQTFVDIMASPNVQVLPPVSVQAYLNTRLSWAEDDARRGHDSPQKALERIAHEVDRETQHAQAQ